MKCISLAKVFHFPRPTKESFLKSVKGFEKSYFPRRRCRRRNYSFQHRMSRREGAVPVRDDGVCLTTLRARRAGPVKGGVRRQAPSRLREPLKAVMEPAAATPRMSPDSDEYEKGRAETLPWNRWSNCWLAGNIR